MFVLFDTYRHQQQQHTILGVEIELINEYVLKLIINFISYDLMRFKENVVYIKNNLNSSQLIKKLKKENVNKTNTSIMFLTLTNTYRNPLLMSNPRWRSRQRPDIHSLDGAVGSATSINHKICIQDLDFCICRRSCHLQPRWRSRQRQNSSN
ncbi:hypothetical protein FF38_02557 [Lucilia cuprina]|uniref:Uncharacterized protein n=1 Tax=Lucilia cuprina TaxID=7375 RepID=A0A0L0C1I1_LUCCU|nr:hypothetical protein FF38_02557 [Lucilia cuprina]